MLYCLSNDLGVTAIPEDATNKECIDLTLDVLQYRIVMEFKVDGTAESVLAQIKFRQYADKYLSENKPIDLLGNSFDNTQRNISTLIWEKLP